MTKHKEIRSPLKPIDNDECYSPIRTALAYFTVTWCSDASNTNDISEDEIRIYSINKVN